MSVASHQTIKLSKGKHSSAEHGACVMELASMLAGEPFTDHPRSVSRAIGAFLRGYNDLLDDGRRQDLYRYAAGCVGTAANPPVEQARIVRLIRWGDAQWRSAAGSSWLARLRSSRTRGHGTGPEGAASYALRALNRSDCPHDDVLALLDELIALGTPGAPLELSGGGLEGLELTTLSQLG